MCCKHLSEAKVCKQCSIDTRCRVDYTAFLYFKIYSAGQLFILSIGCFVIVVIVVPVANVVVIVSVVAVAKYTI